MSEEHFKAPTRSDNLLLEWIWQQMRESLRAEEKDESQKKILPSAPFAAGCSFVMLGLFSRLLYSVLASYYPMLESDPKDFASIVWAMLCLFCIMPILLGLCLQVAFFHVHLGICLVLASKRSSVRSQTLDTV